MNLAFYQSDKRYEVWQQYNQVLRDISNDQRFSDHVILIESDKFETSLFLNDNYIVDVHPNAIGYYELALHYNTLIEQALQANLSKACVKTCMFNDIPHLYMN